MTLDELLASGLQQGVFTRAALAVWRDDACVVDASTAGGQGAYDVASVTKAVTAVAALRQAAPDERVPWLDGAPTVAQLLSHASGLPAWRPLFAHAARALGVSVAQLVTTPSLHAAARRIYQEIVSKTAVHAARPTYSDLGFFALGEWLWERTGRTVGALQRELVSTASDGFFTGAGRPRRGNPDVEAALVSPDEGARDAACDDDNAACLGGACGHAGLFATAAAVAEFGDRLRRDALDGSGGLLPRNAALAMFTRTAGSRTLGLDTPSGDAPSIGSILGRGPLGAAGHLGFTGCSLWIDRDARLSIALCTDAVSLARPSPAIRAFRPVVHDAVARLLGA